LEKSNNEVRLADVFLGCGDRLIGNSDNWDSTTFNSSVHSSEKTQRFHDKDQLILFKDIFTVFCKDHTQLTGPRCGKTQGLEVLKHAYMKLELYYFSVIGSYVLALLV
jgi:hypothetical protein